jgi:hypothetical protein
VWFENAHARDLLVTQSPFRFGDVQVSIVRHNEGRNWRALQFSRECWLMLMGFPLDHWNHECIQNAISSFGRLLLWENDRAHLARLLVKARVTELESDPHFLVISEAEGFQGKSWMMQCEILDEHLLGGLLADEEPIPELNANGQPPIDDFFGLG